MRIYSSIPVDVKPPTRATKLHFGDAFDSDFALLLNERRSTTLTYMVDDAIEVDSNFIASGKMKGRAEIKHRSREENYSASSSQTSDERMDMMMKTMERLMEG